MARDANQEEADTGCALLRLPDELLSLVALFCDVRALGALACCCARLRRLCYDNHVWRGRLSHAGLSGLLPDLDPPCGRPPRGQELRAAHVYRHYLASAWRTGRGASLEQPYERRLRATSCVSLIGCGSDRSLLLGGVPDAGGAAGGASGMGRVELVHGATCADWLCNTPRTSCTAAAAVCCALVASEADVVVAGCEDGTWAAWHTASGAPFASGACAASGDSVCHAAHAGGRGPIALVDRAGSAWVLRLDAADGPAAQLLAATGLVVGGAAFAARGRTLCLASHGLTVVDVETQTVRPAHAQAEWYWAVAPTALGDTVVACVGRNVPLVLYDLRAGPRPSMVVRSVTGACLASVDRTLVIGACDSGAISAWDCAAAETVFLRSMRGLSRVAGLAASAEAVVACDGSAVAAIDLASDGRAALAALTV